MKPAGLPKRARGASAVHVVEVGVEGKPIPRWRGKVQRFCARVLHAAGASQWELSLLLCDDEKMRALNRQYRGKDSTTDVLSFPREAARLPRTRLLDGAVVTGDIAISMDMVRRNAGEYGVTEDEELKRLLVHGILHCAGMDHGTTGRGRMLSFQESLLRALKKERIIEK
ncbi:MAG TPA: rRNA maturation RNase YbeY [Spirochaetia bacterium]|nr:rRNA maturation RNase YbeY [Spirochaetia bacterium]